MSLLLCSVLEIELTTYRQGSHTPGSLQSRLVLFFSPCTICGYSPLLQSPWPFFNSYNADSSLCLSTLHKLLFHSDGALLPVFPGLLHPWYLSLNMISLRELGFSKWIWSSAANFFYRILVVTFIALMFSNYSCMFVSFPSVGIIDVIYCIIFLMPTIVLGTLSGIS